MSQETNCQKGAIIIGRKSIPVACVVAPANFTRTKLTHEISNSLGQNYLASLCCSCRGVPWTRLPVILATGCDVEPSDSPIFASCLEKALEYGHEGDQVIQVFDHESLRPSFCERSASLTEEERAEIEKDYPTVIPNVDGSMLWFTRLSPDDSRAATGYEREYGYWLPGKPIDALCALILISSDTQQLAEYLPSSAHLLSATDK